jgi:uncharacterized protein (TIGR03437 family)
MNHHTSPLIRQLTRLGCVHLGLYLLGASAQTPHIKPEGVVNGATLTAEVSPGCIMLIKGSNLATAAAAASTSPLLTNMNGTQVLVDGIPSPLLYVSPSQVDVQVPWEANKGVALSVQVSVNGVLSNKVSVASTTFSPGVFSLPSGQGSIVTLDGALAAPLGTYFGSRPVRPGEFISIYATGMGTVNNRPGSGVAALSQPLSIGRTNPTVTIGGVTAPRTFFGLAPGFAGLYQVNVQVAANTPGGDAVPVVVSNAGTYIANTVTIAVAAPPLSGTVPPTVTSFTPPAAPAGATVTIAGTGLTQAANVSFGGILTANLTTVSDTAITAVVPTGATSGPIAVTTLAGTAVSTTNFTVTAAVSPTINSFTPSNGRSGTDVTITGTGFLGTTAVSINGYLASWNVASDTTVTATVEDGSSTGPIAVTTPGGTAISGTNFAVTAFSGDGPPGGAINSIATDPRTPGTLYVGTSIGVFKSANGGTNWIPANAGLVESIGPLAIDPSNPSTIYAGTDEDGTDVAVFKSTDGGTTWAASSSGIPVFTNVRAIAIDPSNPSTIYMGRVGSGVFKSIDAGTSWVAANNGLTDNTHFFSLVIAPTSPPTLYAGTRLGGVFKSTNGGASWTTANSGLGDLAIFTLAVDPSNPSSIYAGTFGGGIFKSTNGGASWASANNGFPLPVPAINAVVFVSATPSTIYAGTIEGIFKSTDSGSSWTKVLPDGGTIAVDPFNTSTIYAATGSGVSKSTDGGSSWVAANNGIALPIPGIDTLAIDPLHPSTIYAGVDQGGKVFKTTDGGSIWTSANNGLPSGTLFIRTLAIDPSDTSTIYAATGSGVYKSTNGGSSWASANNGIPSFAFVVPALTIDPSHSTTLYAGTGFGFYKSTDGAASWTAVNNGLPSGNTSVRVMAVAPSNPSTIFAGAFLGAFRSTDGGANWVGLTGGLAGVDAIAINPSSPSTIYFGRARGTLLKSTDSGSTVASLVNGLPSPPPSVAALAIDPTNPSVVYAGTGSGVFKSTDGGSNWTAMSSGLEGANVLALVIDPSNPSTIYVGTSEGKVFKSISGGTTWQPTGL